VKDLQNTMMCQGAEDDLPGAGSRAHAAGEEDPLAREVAHDLTGRARAAEGFEDQAHAVLDLRVGIEHDLSACVVDQPQGRGHPELAAAGLMELAAQQAGAQHMELGFAHGAFEAEEQAVIEVARIVEPILVELCGAPHNSTNGETSIMWSGRR